MILIHYIGLVYHALVTLRVVFFCESSNSFIVWEILCLFICIQVYYRKRLNVENVMTLFILKAVSWYYNYKRDQIQPESHEDLLLGSANLGTLISTSSIS